MAREEQALEGRGGDAAADMSDDAIRAGIRRFDRWFAHTDFGNGIVARSTAWPDAPSDSIHMGVAKFEFIVRPNLPDLQGKRILDLGCNNGLIAIHMARLGAREVLGIDCSRYWPRVIEQAEFVKAALEWRCATRYNTRYLDMEFGDLTEHDFGRFDAAIALNSLYYLEEAEIERVVRHLATITDHLVVQCNTRDHRVFGARRTPRFMAAALARNGFPTVTVDRRWDRPRRGIVPQRYHRPVVVGRRPPATAGGR